MSVGPTKPILTYLFVAHYRDGTLYCQTPDDVSMRDATRSAFFDVEHDRLHSFALVNDDNIWAVDLVDGHFEHNGVPFTLHTDPKIGTVPLELIYYRTAKVESTLGEEGNETTRNHYYTGYTIGWSTTLPGSKTIQHTITVV